MDVLVVADPWDVFSQTPAKHAPPSPADHPSNIFAGDFWNPIPATSVDSEATDSGWLYDIRLPEFLPHAAENPFQFQLRAPTVEDKANRRARWLVALLDIPQINRQASYVRRFSELFTAYSHQRTFATLSGLALEGASADELWSAFELKEIWAMEPRWWSIRRRGSREPLAPSGGRTMLGWTAACRLIVQRKGLPAEAIIDDDWFNDWLDLSYGDPLYWRFLDYAEARIDAFAAGVLEMPIPPRRGILRLRDVAIDGVAILNNPARTMLLKRCATDSFAFSFKKPSAEAEAPPGALQ